MPPSFHSSPLAVGGGPDSNPLPATTLRRTGHGPHLGSKVELTLQMGTEDQALRVSEGRG